MQKEFWRYSGTFLILTGVIHVLFGVYFGWDVITGIFHDGLFNTIFENSSRIDAMSNHYLNVLAGFEGVQELQRFGLYWFMVTGFFWVAAGQLGNRIIEIENKPLPLSFGYFLLVYTVIACSILPVQGSWLFLPQALIIISANRKIKKIA
jgi:hypothetical protein